MSRVTSKSEKVLRGAAFITSLVVFALVYGTLSQDPRETETLKTVAATVGAVIAFPAILVLFGPSGRRQRTTQKQEKA